jgi:hypothetical protein
MNDLWMKMMQEQAGGQPPMANSPQPMQPMAAPSTPAPGQGLPAAGGGAAINPQDKAMMDLYSRISGLQPQQQEIARKKAMIGQLRQGAAMPGMRQAGRVQQAANPLEFLSSLGHAGAAAYQGQQQQGLEDQYSKDRANEFGAFRKTMGFGQ